MYAPAAARSFGRNWGIVACSAPTAQCPARQCKQSVPLAVARLDRGSNLSRLARKHIEHSNCVVDTSRGFACRIVRVGAHSSNHLDRGPRLDGRRLRCELPALWSHALPLHRPVLSGDDCAGYYPRLYFVGHLPMDCVGGRCRRWRQADLAGDRACLGQVLIADPCPLLWGERAIALT